jgi:hypothetical protein
MTEIFIQRKQRRVWPWVAVVLLLVLIACLFLLPFGENAAVVVSPRSNGALNAAAEGAIPGEVDAYLRHVQRGEARDRMGPEHDYTADGIRRLAAAIGAIAIGDTVAGHALESQLAELRQRADALQRDPSANTHALATREAFLIAAGMLEGIQQRRFPELASEATAVRRAAEATQAKRPLLEQKAEVQQFFDEASGILRGMTNAAG